MFIQADLIALSEGAYTAIVEISGGSNVLRIRGFVIDKDGDVEFPESVEASEILRREIEEVIRIAWREIFSDGEPPEESERVGWTMGEKDGRR